jgi:hypothetical protein
MKASHLALAAAAFGVAASLSLALPAAAQKPAADLKSLGPTPTDFTPKKTPWGDWDFTGTWPYDYPAQAKILFQRPDGYKDRLWLTPEEHDKRVKNAGNSDKAYNPEKTGITTQAGTQGLADWVKTSNFSWRTSLLVSPKNGQLPPLTPHADALFKAGRSGWVPNQTFDWVDDFDTWDRCITRGFPASVFPNRYNNALHVSQSPGYIVLDYEILATRIIPIVKKEDVHKHWPANVEAWMGDARAYWEGKTLVIETTNIKSGDSATRDPARRAASPVINTMVGGYPRNTIPTSTRAHAIERLTMTGPKTILYEITYDDPEVFTAPWSAQLEWTKDDSYLMPEYACHEGDEQIRNYITSSRAARAATADGKLDAKYNDGNARWDRQFDVDPVSPGAPPPAPRGARNAAAAATSPAPAASAGAAAPAPAANPATSARPGG